MKVVKFMQDGGTTPAPVQAAPAEPQQDPVLQLVDMAMQAIQSGDANLAMQVCEGLIMLVQQAQGGPQGPVDAPVEGSPVFKKGGKLIKRKKCRK